MLHQLHYKTEGSGQPILLLHGLFGSLDNLGLLARDLSQDHYVLSVDLRNHGRSPHNAVHDYDSLARDVLRLLEELNLSQVTVIGHSMGGKVAMNLAPLCPERIKQLIVMDMAPVAYQQHRHDEVFAGIAAVADATPASRTEAMALLSQHIEMEGVKQFLGKSLYKAEHGLAWRFNYTALKQQYEHIIGWQTIAPQSLPTLFIKGEQSDYITADYQQAILAQFPNARAHVVANTGHWLHAEKPAMVLKIIRKFIR